MASSATDFMKPSSWDKQLGLALLQEHAASQSDQTVNPSKNEVRNGGGAGCKSPHPHRTEGRVESFLLDILFYRMSENHLFRYMQAASSELCRDNPDTRSDQKKMAHAERVTDRVRIKSSVIWEPGEGID